MSVSSIFLFIAFLASISVIIVWPLIQPTESRPTNPKPVGKTALQEEHEAVLVAIRDLDFDYQLGKLTPDDYQTQRETLVERGVQILKQLESA